MSKSNLPLVLIHGWSAHSGYFAEVAEQFAQHRQVLTPDLPGHRGESCALQDATIEHLADWLSDYLNLKGIHSAFFCGWSMGAHVLLSYIQRHGQEKVAGLIVEDMSPRILNAEKWNLGLKSGLNVHNNLSLIAAIETSWPKKAQSTAEAIFATNGTTSADETPHPQQEWVSQETRQNNPQLLARFWESMSQQDFRALLPDIHRPALVISGAKSRLYETAAGQYFADHMASASHLVFTESGHAPHLEQSEEFVEEVEAFLSRTELLKCLPVTDPQ